MPNPARGVEVPDVVKTIVVRRGEGDLLFVLTPGGRVISWPKLRARASTASPSSSTRTPRWPRSTRRWPT
ncbi:hypothetical protein ABZ487_19960 [Micromonospora aurantiaca]